MDAASERLVDLVVAGFVREGRMFTAADVASEARSRGGSVFEPETAVRLRLLFEAVTPASDYTFTSVNIGRPEWVTVYHRPGDDPQRYSSGGMTPVSPPQMNPAAKPGFFSWLSDFLFGARPDRPPPVQQPPRTASPDRFTPPPSRPSSPPMAPRPAPQRSAAAPSKSPPKPPQRGPQTLGLDAGQFLPIKREELVKAASGIRLWGSVWFGRRDLIPPADDPRTNLIDRALVTNGLLSPEQLAEIHRVGAEMERVRPQLETARQEAARAGAAAVEADRAERAKIKEQKKAEATKKKQQRAAEIRRRKETDIVFLGRGVSSRLGDRTSNVVRLNELGLPVLFTPADLAAALNLTIPQLRWLAFHTDVAMRTHYVHFTAPKRSGGVRTLSAPHKRLKTAQEWILRSILDKLPTEPHAHGFIANRNILTNALPHVGKQVLVNMDLEGFFPSIPFPRVRSVFQRSGYSPAVATILALLCTECPRRQVQYAGKTYFVATGQRGLPQGACTSPALSNQVARRLDKRLQGIAAKMNLSFTRYADDLTFSGNDELKERVGYVMARVRHIAQEEGFVVNEKKSRILRRNASQQVTGLVVNDHPAVLRKEVRRLRAILYSARQTGLEAQNREGHTNFQAWLLGKIAFVGLAQPEVADKLWAQFVQLGK